MVALALRATALAFPLLRQRDGRVAMLAVTLTLVVFSSGLVYKSQPAAGTAQCRRTLTFSSKWNRGPFARSDECCSSHSASDGAACSGGRLSREAAGSRSPSGVRQQAECNRRVEASCSVSSR
jgi:hypothetical protein